LSDWIQEFYCKHKFTTKLIAVIGTVAIVLAGLIKSVEGVIVYRDLPNEVATLKTEVASIKAQLNNFHSDQIGSFCVQIALIEERNYRDCTWLMSPEARSLLGEMRGR
jgi:hypothetical protein